ncbi:MAG: hypothetical protein OHK0024_25350 [Thalassobaculales bacterium]
MARGLLDRQDDAPSAAGSAMTRRPNAALKVLFDSAFDPDRPEQKEFDRAKRYKLSPEEQAADIVDQLRDAIEASKDGGAKGMRLRDWRKLAREEIADAIRHASTKAALDEVMSARRIGALMIRSAFLMVAAVLSFFAFWGGVVWMGQAFGALWSTIATISALVLAAGFVALGLWLGDTGGDKDG